MMTNHSINVDCPPELAFDFCRDVSRWPEMFPPCLEAEVLEESGEMQRIALCAKANGQIMRWESIRQIDRERLSISFVQSRPSPLVSAMRGSWRFTREGSGTAIALTHEFSVKPEVRGLVEGVHDAADAEAFMLRTIEENSRRELDAYQRELNRLAWRHEFSASLRIPHRKGAVYKLLRDAASWPWLLPHCRAVELLYDDSYYQEFLMTVEVAGQREQMRSVRMLHPSHIDYFQPEPPPALKEHRGRWSLVERETEVEVTSWHAVVLNPDHWAGHDSEGAKQKVEAAINRNSLGTLSAIQAKLGEDGHVHA